MINTTQPAVTNQPIVFSGILFLKLFAFIFNIITWFIIYFKIRPTSELIPLHFNVFSGTDAIGKGYYIYLIPLVGLMIIFINEVFYRYSKHRDEFSGSILVGISLLAQIIILISILRLRSKILI